jgi:DNA-binding PadR family transcriptional regulator
VDRYVSSEQQPGAMRSSIAWALLGLVIERSSYGWELVQRFRRIYGETLVLSGHARIYTALEALRVRSLIEEVHVEASDAMPARQPKPHYRATAKGVSAYQEWLFNQMEEERQRQRLFARQLTMLEPGTALEVIDEYERQWLTEADEASPAESEREAMAERLAQGEEQMNLTVRLRWIEFARKELRALVEQPLSEPAPKARKR